jgi:ferric-dicitrate binding protein FerR (iron transport regulator)
MSSSHRPEPPLEILDGMRHPVPMQERPDAESRRVTIDAIAVSIRRGRANARTHQRRLAACAVAAFLVCAGAAWAFASYGTLAAHPKPSAVAARSAPSARPASIEGALHVVAGTVVATHGAAPATVRAGSDLSVEHADELSSAANSEALLTLPRGVLVKLVGLTTARLVSATDAEQHLRLDVGRVEVSVPRPGGPRLFAIQTPDSEVTVHGTEFSVVVKREGDGPFTTAVTVTRGSVQVMHAGRERMVEAGSSWSSSGDQDVPPSPVTASAVPEPQAADLPLASPRRSAHAATSLAEQNRLFQAFLDARDQGDDAGAVKYLNTLLTRFPDTPLGDQARLARFRTLQRLAGEADKTQ